MPVLGIHYAISKQLKPLLLSKPPKTTVCYFLTSVARSYFRFIGKCILTSNVGIVGLAAPKPSSQVSAGISTSGRNSTSGLNSTSSSTLTLRPPLARDLVTIAEDGPAPGRVTAGIGAVSRGAGTESDLPDKSVQPTLRFASESISITGNYWQITYWLSKICADCWS